MIIGFSFLGAGLILFYYIFHGNAVIKTVSLFMAGYISLIGILIMIAFRFFDIHLQGLIICSGVGGLFLLAGIYNSWKVLACKIPVVALYEGRIRYYGLYGISRDAPIFRFEYQGRQYEGTSGESFRRGFLDTRYQEGNPYTIFVNRCNPRIFICKRKLRLLDTCMILGGLISVLAGVCLFI